MFARRSYGIRHRGVRALGGGGRRGGAGRAPGAPRPQRRQPCITAPGLGRRGCGNACVTRRGGLLIIERRELPRNFAGSAHSLSPARYNHSRLLPIVTTISSTCHCELGRGRRARNRRLPPLFLAGGVSGRGARFGYIAVKVHRLEGRASRQLYCPMRARSPCRRELASP